MSDASSAACVSPPPAAPGEGSGDSVGPPRVPAERAFSSILSLTARPSSRRSLALLAAVGVLWLATLAVVYRTEVLSERPSEDVQALIDQARLRKEHASAVYEVRLGELPVGEISSTVSGGQREEQLLYRLQGHLTQPVQVRVTGFVLAGWDRRPERFVLEAFTAGQRHRVAGGLRHHADGVLFEAHYQPPEGGELRSFDFVLPSAPLLAPGPLPVPEMAGSVPGSVQTGTLADPISGEPVDWRIDTEELNDFVVAGASRAALRHSLLYGAWTASLWTEPSGFPLAVELPLGLRVVLQEESR